MFQTTNPLKEFHRISNFQKQILIYAMLIGGILAGKAQTNAQLPTGVKNTVETSIMNKTGQNIDAIVADEMASIDKIWGQSTQLRALSQSYTIETPSPEFDTFFAGIDWTNMNDVSTRYSIWVRNVANPNGDPGCSTCPQDVTYGLHSGANAGANWGGTWIGDNTTASASTVDSKSLNPDDVIDGTSMKDHMTHELGGHNYGIGQISGSTVDHPYGKEIPLDQLEIFVNGQWIDYPLNFPFKTIMSAGSGRPVATNTANFSTSTDGFMYFKIDDGTGSGPIYPARTPISQLVNNGLETLPKIADELITPTGMFHNRLREISIPTNEKIENMDAPEFTIAADGTLSLPTTYSTILTNANINPDNCQYFIYDQSDTTDHQNIPRNNVAENVGWNLGETLNINDYGYTTATASNLRVRVLAVKQNQLSQVGSPTLSVADREIAGFKMYPNPVKDRLTIKTANDAIDEIIIFNALGQEVFSEKYDGDYLHIELDVNNLPAEKMYFIKTTSGRKTQVEKFIKE